MRVIERMDVEPEADQLGSRSAGQYVHCVNCERPERRHLDRIRPTEVFLAYARRRARPVPKPGAISSDLRRFYRVD